MPKTYKCAECEKEKVKERFYEGTLDNDPVWWTCKQCHRAYANDTSTYGYMMTMEEISRQMEKDD
jgi:ribosomal protein L37AE/L43A